MSPNGIAVTIARRGDRLVAEVKLVGRGGVLIGVRTMEAGVGDCGELSDAIALAVGIALDMIEKSAPATTVPEVTPSSKDESERSPAPRPLDPPAPSTSKRSAGPVDRAADPAMAPKPSTPGAQRSTNREVLSHWFELGAAVGASLGDAPAISWGPSLFVSWRSAIWEVGLEGWAKLAASMQVAAIPTAVVRTWLVAGGPSACIYLAAWFGCALAQAGFFDAAAPGIVGSTAGKALYLALGGRAGASVQLPMGLIIRPSLSLLAQPLDLTVEAGGQRIWRAPPVVGTAELAVAMRIP
jgi:hypothetical protein